MRAALVLAILAVPALAEESLEKLVEDLGSKAYGVRNRAYTLLAQRKDERVIPLVTARIESWPPENQYRALLVLCEFPPRKSHPAMKRLLKSDDPHLRAAAAAQLHRRGERGMVDVIVAVLRDPPKDETVLLEIVSRLRYLDVPEILEAMRALLTPDRSENTLRSLLAWFSSDDYEGAQAEAKRIVEQDKRAGLRAVASAYLLRCRDASKVPVLTETLRDAELDASTIARVKLILADGGIYPPEVCAAVLERLPKETNSYVATSLIEMLVAAHYYEARKPLSKLIEHENDEIAEAALGALAALDGMPETASVRRMLKSDSEKRRLMGARILRRMDEPGGFETVLAIARGSKNITVRRDAIEALGEYRSPDAIEPLIEALADADTSVRSYALSGLRVTLYTVFPYRRFDFATLPYTYDSPAAERTAAVAKLRAWWKKNRDAEW